MKKTLIFLYILIKGCSNEVENTNVEGDDSIKECVDYNFISEALNIDSHLVLVNKCYKLPDDYVPDLVRSSLLMSVREIYLEKNALEALERFVYESDYNYLIYSGYRSYDYQEEVYIKNNRDDSVSARPGHSEHQTGLAVDISTEYYGLTSNFGYSTEGKYLMNNIHKYGFILRYPEDKTSVTRYSYEPWHIRYVGIDAATFMFNNDLTLEEYLEYKVV